MVMTGGRAFLIFLFTLAGAVCLVFGLTLPVIRLTQLYFWTDTHSLISVISALYHANELFLAAVISIFSIIFPAFKLVYIAALGTLRYNDVRRSLWLKRVEWLGKWSMLDVLVLALLVFYAKSTQLVDAIALPGIYFFATSVVFTMVAYGLLEKDDPVGGAQSSTLTKQSIDIKS